MTLVEQARAIYVQYMRRSIAAQGAECSEDAIAEVIDGSHDEKHGVQITLLALETQAAEIARLRGLLGEAEGALDAIASSKILSLGRHWHHVVEEMQKVARTTLAKLRAEKEDG